MKYYITKWALTTGILEKDLEIAEVGDGKYVTKPGVYGLYRLGKEAFADRNDAVRRAGSLRNKKLVSLLKQVEKIKELKFE